MEMELSTKDDSISQGVGEIVQKDSQQQQQQQQQQFTLSEEDKLRLKRQLDQKVGTASIKLDFIDYSKIHLLYGIENIGNNAQPQQPTEGVADDNDSSEPPAKKAKKKNRGQNKKRPFREKRIDASLRLCPKLIISEACQYREKCMFSHDVAKIVQGKDPDLGPVCYNFDTYGKCHRGIMCRYGSSHITADYKNVVDEEKWNRCKDKSVTKNNISWDVKNRLWKRKMKFAKSDKYLAGLSKTVKERIERQRIRESSSQKLESKTTESAVENSSSTVCKKQDQPTPSKPIEDVAQNDRTSTAEDAINAKDENVKRTTDNSSVEKLESSGPTANLPQSVGNHKPQTSSDQSGLVSSSGNQLPCQPESSNQHSGVVTDEDLIKLKSGEKKTVDFRDKLYLAPLTTVGNLPFRRVCKGFGADITCGEMAICTNLLQGQVSEWALLKRHSSEDVFGVQIAGAFPDTMTKCAELLNDTIDIDFLDINVGCPIDIVYNKGAGCGLMNRVGKFEDIVRGMSTVLDVPLTVKMRTGIYDKHLVAAKMIPRIYNWGASAVTLHGRTREQRYTKSADWDYITQCVKAAEPHPLLGNGDILSFEDANLFKEKSGVTGMMIARGALIKPWIFTEIKEQRHWDISSQERFDYLQSFVNYGMEHWGSDTEGVEKTRRFLLEWLSFLYRYIPVGVLETVPQQINQRPPHYIGRNDLETLMASANCKDWIKISEMLLGPVPNNFQFLPKHKANSYN